MRYDRFRLDIVQVDYSAIDQYVGMNYFYSDHTLFERDISVWYMVLLLIIILMGGSGFPNCKLILYHRRIWNTKDSSHFF